MPTDESDSASDKIIALYQSWIDRYQQVLDDYHKKHLEVGARHEKIVLTLSGGALLLSVSFVTQVIPNPTAPAILFAAWLAFGISVVAVLLASKYLMTGFEELAADTRRVINSINEMITRVQTRQPIPKSMPLPSLNMNAQTTRQWATSSAVGIWAFVVGAILFAVFVAINWLSTKSPTP